METTKNTTPKGQITKDENMQEYFDGNPSEYEKEYNKYYEKEDNVDDEVDDYYEEDFDY